MPAANCLPWNRSVAFPRARRWTYAGLSIKQKEGLPLFKAGLPRLREETGR
jgi:hypothetical protein